MEPTDWTTAMNALTATFAQENPLETTAIQVGIHTLDVALARTPEQWVQGLVGRSDVNALLFVMPSGTRFPFHMRHVDRDIVIAFFDDRGTMVDRADLEAQVGFTRPAQPYTYVLELTKPVGSSLLDDLSHGITFPAPL
jgi:uncharacterized membrane protein (UPF0127 family)